MSRHNLTESELRNMLKKQFGINVRLWDVDCNGVFAGIVFDTNDLRLEWRELVKELK